MKQNSYICFMFQAILQHVSKCVSLTPDEAATLASLLTYQEFPKKKLLLKEGQICDFELFINKGCIRTYYVDDKGEEVTLQLAIEGWWVSDISSFHERRPSTMYIETLEACEVLVLSPERKEKLLAEIPQLERMFRLLVQRSLANMQERFFRTVSTNATEKYLDFIERYPTVPNRVAQHYIASYLGFSPEFLSKVRSRLAKK